MTNERRAVELARRSAATDVARPAGAHALRRWLAGLAVLPMVVGVLSLSVVFAQPVHAYATAPSPIDIGKTALKSPAGRMVTTVGSMTPWGRAVKIGMLAYSTKDAWWPVAEGFLGNKGGDEQADNASGCGITAGSTGIDGAVLSVTASWSGCWTGGHMGNTVYVEAGSCVSSVGSTPMGTNVAAGIPNSANDSGTGSVSMTLCGAGQRIGWVRWNVAVSSAPVVGRTNSITTTGPFDAASTVQTTEVVCRQSDGTTVTISESLRGFPDRVAVPSCADRVPGSIPWSGKIKAGPDGTTPKVLTEWTTKQDVFEEYSDCFGENGLKCEVRIWVDGEPCTLDGNALCRNWKRMSDDPLTAERVKCKFGTHIIDVSDCESLNYKSEVKTRPLTATEPDGTTKTDPEAEPSTTPGGEGLPKSGENPHAPGKRPDGSTDPDTQSCFGEMWSWNPVDWVYVPIKCAFLWAFVPKDLPDFRSVGSPLPAGWLPELPNFGESECGPLTMPKLELGYKGWDVGPTELVNTCDRPWPLVRTFTYYGLLALTLVTVVWQSFRAVTSGLGMGVSTGPGGGEDT